MTTGTKCNEEDRTLILNQCLWRIVCLFFHCILSLTVPVFTYSFLFLGRRLFWLWKGGRRTVSNSLFWGWFFWSFFIALGNLYIRGLLDWCGLVILHSFFWSTRVSLPFIFLFLRLTFLILTITLTFWDWTILTIFLRTNCCIWRFSCIIFLNVRRLLSPFPNLRSLLLLLKPDKHNIQKQSKQKKKKWSMF